MDNAECKKIIAMMTKGQIDGITSCNKISEGTDIPRVTVAILLRKTMSKSLFLQQIGRALRPFPGKEKAIILDHVGNRYAHGLPDDPQKWSLDAEKRKARKGQNEFDEEKVINTKQCSECYIVHKPAPTCPRCGFIYGNFREIKELDGELIKENRQEQELENIRLKKEAEERKKDIRRQKGAARTLEELEALEKELGYKRGWAQRMFKIRGGK
jgi:superfamily II DNA or RNA helicase